MKIPNLVILNTLYNGDPKVTPLTFGWLDYTKKVKEVIVHEFVKEIGAEPIKNSPLDLRISIAAKNYAKVARRHFKAKKGNYKRATAQHFFKCTTHIRLQNEKKKKATIPNPSPNPDGDATIHPEPAVGPSQAPPKKPFVELGRTEKNKRVNKLKEDAGGDADLLLAAAISAAKDMAKTASSVAKDLHKNRHFVLKKMQADPELAAHLQTYLGKGLSKLVFLKNQSC